MFRQLVRLGSFPACWRQTNVTPIPKGLMSSSVANHRPISITSVLTKVFEHLHGCRFALDDLWNTVVCFQPPSLHIGKVWVPVMHFCSSHIYCKVHWRVGRRLGLYNGLILIVQIDFSAAFDRVCISSVLYVLDLVKVSE